MAQMTEDSQALEPTTIGIYRTATVVKGGRRFSFAALVAVGDRNGSVGLGYGKAPGVPDAIEKAQKDARKQMRKVKLQEGTLPHPVEAKFGASIVKLVPAAPGTGVIAGATVRAVLELAGVKDCLTKAYGSTNQKNLAKATLQGLQMLRRRDEFERIRGVKLEETEAEQKIEAGRHHVTPTAPASPMPKASTSKPQQPAEQNKQEEPDKAGKPDRAPEVQDEAPAAEATAATETPTPAPESAPEQPTAEAPHTPAGEQVAAESDKPISPEAGESAEAEEQTGEQEKND